MNTSMEINGIDLVGWNRWRGRWRDRWGTVHHKDDDDNHEIFIDSALQIL